MQDDLKVKKLIRKLEDVRATLRDMEEDKRADVVSDAIEFIVNSQWPE